MKNGKLVNHAMGARPQRKAAPSDNIGQSGSSYAKGPVQV